MKRWLAAPIALLAVVGFAALWSPTDAATKAKPSGWITLFDGSSLDNWTPIGNANWKLADGVVTADAGNGFLISKNSYANFEIRAEFWVDQKANSGVFIRCADPTQATAKLCYEVNIFDERPDPTYGTGAIVDVAKVVPMPKAAGKWNTYDIVARGPVFVVTLNGKRTVNGARDATHAAGWIGLQYASGVVKFRKVEIRPL